VWGNGQTPTQSVLGMRCWKVSEQRTATWGTMFLRELCHFLLALTVIGAVISFIFMLTNKDRRTLYDMAAGVVVLHDPQKVLAGR
jgi:uncharacterized RDD family membrane protein YckC